MVIVHQLLWIRLVTILLFHLNQNEISEILNVLNFSACERGPESANWGQGYCIWSLLRTSNPYHFTAFRHRPCTGQLLEVSWEAPQEMPVASSIHITSGRFCLACSKRPPRCGDSVTFPVFTWSHYRKSFPGLQLSCCNLESWKKFKSGVFLILLWIHWCELTYNLSEVWSVMVLSPWQCRIYRQECCLKGVGTGGAGMLSAAIQWSQWAGCSRAATSASGMEFKLSWESENCPMLWNIFL